MPVKWIDTLGGPLIVVPAAKAAGWSGDDQGGRDYDRACAVGGWLGVLDCDDADALVLGDEPAMTCCVPAGEGVVIARWIWADSAEDVARALGELPADGFEPEDLTFRVEQSSLVVFDSVLRGDSIEDCLTIDLPRGAYSASTRTWDPDDTTRLVLHRLFRR